MVILTYSLHLFIIFIIYAFVDTANRIKGAVVTLMKAYHWGT